MAPSVHNISPKNKVNTSTNNVNTVASTLLCKRKSSTPDTNPTKRVRLSSSSSGSCLVELVPTVKKSLSTPVPSTGSAPSFNFDIFPRKENLKPIGAFNSASVHLFNSNNAKAPAVVKKVSHIDPSKGTETTVYTISVTKPLSKSADSIITSVPLPSLTALSSASSSSKPQESEHNENMKYLKSAALLLQSESISQLPCPSGAVVKPIIPVTMPKQQTQTRLRVKTIKNGCLSTNREQSSSNLKIGKTFTFVIQ